MSFLIRQVDRSVFFFLLCGLSLLFEQWLTGLKRTLCLKASPDSSRGLPHLHCRHESEDACEKASMVLHGNPKNLHGDHENDAVGSQNRLLQRFSFARNRCPPCFRQTIADGGFKKTDPGQPLAKEFYRTV